MADLHPAIWQGPFPAELPDSSLVLAGEEHLVSDEDLKSSWWQAVKEPAPAPASPTAQTPAAAQTTSQGAGGSPAGSSGGGAS